MAINIKDPNSIVDYQYDWSAYLAQEGNDTIHSATITIDNPAGGASDLNIVQTTNSTTTVTVWLQKGIVNTTYQVTCQIVTTGGRTDYYTTLIRVSTK